jgi:hypothetical protein
VNCYFIICLCLNYCVEINYCIEITDRVEITKFLLKTVVVFYFHTNLYASLIHIPLLREVETVGFKVQIVKLLVAFLFLRLLSVS